jgi:branched-chain amino acid transport system ATP-binding protein
LKSHAARRTLHGISTAADDDVFKVLTEINKQGTTILLVEQNARMALQFAQRGYVLESGNLVVEGDSKQLLNDPEVKKAYLGG